MTYQLDSHSMSRTAKRRLNNTLRLFLLIFLFPLEGSAAITTVEGHVPGGRGLTVRLMTYADQLSYLRETLATLKIGEDEHFLFSVELTETVYAWIDIEFRQAIIFLQPGQAYEVQLKPGSATVSSSYYDRSPLPLIFIRDDNDHLNGYISDFNALYNDFLLNYAGNVRAKGPSDSFNAFQTAIKLRFQNAIHPYFQDYLKYKTAAMEMFMRIRGRDKIGLDYLAGQPILFSNIEYMDFFHLYFEKYFISGNSYFEFNKSYDLLNSGASLGVILDSLGADPVLKTLGLREMVLLDGLKELYDVQGFRRDRIMALIYELSESAENEVLRKIAGNLAIRLNRLKPGSPAPGFALPEVGTEKQYDLSDFKGKYVYLAFFDSGNPASQAELSLSADLFSRYKDKVFFIAISVDKDPSVIPGNPNILPDTWIILHFQDRFDLLESYDAIAYPCFILIDDRGNIKKCPAPSPSEDIRKAFDAI